MAGTLSVLRGQRLLSDYREVHHGPRRIRDHGGLPDVDPDVLAAQAQQLRPHLRDLAPTVGHRLAAILIDLVMIGLLAAVATDVNAALPVPVVLAFGWMIIRFLPLVLLGQTPGQTLAGYEVRGPRGASLGPLRAAARDAVLLLGAALVWLSLTSFWPAGSSGESSRNALDRRWLHDLLADCWVVRRDTSER